MRFSPGCCNCEEPGATPGCVTCAEQLPTSLTVTLLSLGGLVDCLDGLSVTASYQGGGVYTGSFSSFDVPEFNPPNACFPCPDCYINVSITCVDADEVQVAVSLGYDSGTGLVDCASIGPVTIAVDCGTVSGTGAGTIDVPETNPSTPCGARYGVLDGQNLTLELSA
jgi:hypothetical protein